MSEIKNKIEERLSKLKTHQCELTKIMYDFFKNKNTKVVIFEYILYCVNVKTQYLLWDPINCSIFKSKTFMLLMEIDSFLTVFNQNFLSKVSNNEIKEETTLYFVKHLLYGFYNFNKTSKLFRCPTKSTEEVKKESLIRKQECLNFYKKLQGYYDNCVKK